jgi:hypothetical protein
MEMLFVLALLGGGAYWFFKGNIRRGAEIMRAHLYLTALEHNKTKLEANGLAAHDMSEAPRHFFHMANDRASRDYGGVKLAMVSEAYRLGMQPKLPPWDRASAHAAFEEVAARRKAKAAAQHARSATAQHSAQFPATYDDYYAAFAAELKRLSGPREYELRQVELLEEIGDATGDSLTRQNFSQGVDPKEYAAAVHTVMQRNQAATGLTDFDSYYAAYIAELKRLAGLGPDELHMAEIMDDDRTVRAYRDGVSPHQLAAMLHEHDFGRQVGQHH